MRKLFGILLIVGLALCLTNALALADGIPTVNIHDVIEGSITADYSGFASAPNSLATAGEKIVVSAEPFNFVSQSPDIGLPIGTVYGAYMTDPTTGEVSDYAVLHVTAAQAFWVEFYSDGTADFNPTLFFQEGYGDYSNPAQVVESGALQPLFSAPGLQINAASEVPLPPTVLLMGSGLLGLVGWRRFRKA